MEGSVVKIYCDSKLGFPNELTQVMEKFHLSFIFNPRIDSYTHTTQFVFPLVLHPRYYMKQRWEESMDRKPTRKSIISRLVWCVQFFFFFFFRANVFRLRRALIIQRRRQAQQHNLTDDNQSFCLVNVFNNY